MPKDFDWQTDDQTTWVEEPSDEQPRPALSNLLYWFKRWGRWLGVAAVLLLIVAFVVLNLFNRQVERVEETTISEVLAAHSLVRQAAQEKDFDLLRTMLSSDADDDWQELQVDLLNIDLFLGRRPLRMNIVSDVQPDPEDAPLVTLSPDLQTAELIERIPYQVAAANQVSETIRLEHVFTYQRQGKSWLLSPIPEEDDSFWGNWRSIEESDYFTLIYPIRDEDFALQVSPRLNALIGQICDLEHIKCPRAFSLELRFSKETSSLMRFNEDYNNLFFGSFQSASHFSLPSPTLIGRPTDDKSSEALYRGYANWIAAVMIYRYIDGEAFDDGAVLEVDPFEMLMADLDLELPPSPTIAMPITSPLPTPPTPFPEQDILVACSNFQNYRLMRYNPQSNQWTNDLKGQEAELFTSSTQVFGEDMVPLPDDSGILISVNDFDSEGTSFKILLLEPDQETLILESDNVYQLLQPIISRQFDPSGRKLLILDPLFLQTEDGNVHFVPNALDLEECLSGNCVLQAYSGGFPYWSPDLSWSLLVDTETQSLLSLRDEQTEQEMLLGSGFSPYWIDDEKFIYIRLIEDQDSESDIAPTVEIVKASVDNPMDRTILVSSAEIAAALNPDDPTLPVSVHSLVAHPDQPDWLFMSAAIHPELDPQQDYLLAFDAGTGEITFQVNLDISSVFVPFRFVQDGKMLAIQTYGSESPDGTIIFIPLNPEEKSAVQPVDFINVNSVFNVDWSLDERWLLIVEPDGIRLIAPGQNYDHKVTFDIDACNTAVWINSN